MAGRSTKKISAYQECINVYLFKCLTETSFPKLIQCAVHVIVKPATTSSIRVSRDLTAQRRLRTSYRGALYNIISIGK